MALGKQIGQFSLRSVSQTFGPGPGTALMFHGNMEGTTSGERGEGTVALTHYVEFEPNAKKGTWTQYGWVVLTDGTGIGFRSHGTWEETGPGKWRYRGTGQTSEEVIYATEFEGDASTRTWAGQLYEWS
jgi:hypothetical protein